MQKLRENPEFSITVDKVGSGLWVGVVDATYKKLHLAENMPHWIFYDNPGWCYDGSKITQNCGSGFTEGERVVVTVDFK